MPIELNEVGLRIFKIMRDGDHEAANEWINRKERAFITAVLRPLVLDFCARNGLTFDSGMGSYSFTYMDNGDHFEKFGEKGERLKRGWNKEDEDAQVWELPTMEEAILHKMLETKDLRDHLCLGASVPDVKAHEVNQARQRLGLPIINPA